MVRTQMRNSILPKVVVGLFFLMLSGGMVLADKVDDFIRKEMKRHQIPGLSVAILQNGKFLKSRGYGYANVELEAPASPDTVYQLASITKYFTATAVMQLIEDGRLSLQDKISTHLPHLPKAWSRITTWHLFPHSSGIKSYTQSSAIAEHPGKNFTSGEIISLVAGVPLEFRPGVKR